MQTIWSTLVQDPVKSIDKYFDIIVKVASFQLNVPTSAV